jgi:outer membrane protein TolC
LGSADSGDAELDLSKGYLSGIISIDLAFERTAERNAFRNKIIELESSIRSAQEKEDQIKLQVIDGIRNVKTSRESIITQLDAVRLAEKRQRSTSLFLKAGRAEMRDLLDAEESLLSVRNSLTSAIISYRIAELNIQSDAGLLQVTDAGISQEQPLTKLIPAGNEGNHE